MTTHIPECPMRDRTEADSAAVCICDRLRACEWRIRESIVASINNEFPHPTLGIRRVKRLVDYRDAFTSNRNETTETHPQGAT